MESKFIKNMGFLGKILYFNLSFDLSKSVWAGREKTKLKFLNAYNE